MPEGRDFFLDDRGRVLRVTRHDDDGVVTISVWEDGRCLVTFRLRTLDAPRLADLLAPADETDGEGAVGVWERVRGWLAYTARGDAPDDLTR